MLAAFGRMVKTGMTSVFQAASGVSRLRILSGLFFSKATQGGCQHDGQVADDAQMYGGLATEVLVVKRKVANPHPHRVGYQIAQRHHRTKLRT